MDAKQYAEHIGCSVRQVREWCSQGLIPCMKGGRGYVIIPIIADRALEGMMAQGQPKQEKVKPRPIKRGSFLDELRRI